MSIQACITEFQNLGYHLYLDGGQLRYKCLSLIEPPREKVIPLLETIKTNKKAVIEYLTPKGNLPFDTLKILYLATFNRVGWKIGLMARAEVTQAEDRLNQVWLDSQEGRASFEDFKETLTEWEVVISKAIKTKTKGGNNADRTKD